MRDIFTYPNNASTYYIDPRYIGDNTAGFQKRINDLMNENIYNIDTPPPQSLTDTMTFLGRYYNFYDGFGRSNITLFDFKQFEMAEIVTRSLAVPVTQIASNSDGSATITTSRAHGFTAPSGNVKYNVDITSGSMEDTPFTSGSTSGTHFTFPTTTTINVSTALTSAPGSGFRVHRDGNGARLRTDTSWSGIDSGLRIMYPGGVEYDDSGSGSPSGTAASGTNFYLQTFGNFSGKLYTDDSLTTEATLTEELYQLGSGYGFGLAITGTGSRQTYENVSFSHIDQADKDWLTDQGNGWCRVFHNGTPTGTWTGNVDSTKTIGASRDYSQTFYWEWNSGNSTLTIYDERSVDGSNNVMDWILESGETASLQIDVIEPMRLTEDEIFFRWESGDPVDSDSYFMLEADWDTANNRAFHELDPDETKVYWYGTRVRQYRDSGGNYVAGADIDENVSIPGSGTRPNRTTDSRWVTQPTHTLGFDGNNKLNSWTISGGRFSTADVFRYAQNLSQKADEYVDPGPTNLELAEAEDKFGLPTAWYSNQTGNSGQKVWPKDIKPKSVRVSQKTPIVSTYSQSGLKYARYAGYTRWALDVDYPPLTEEEFRELHATSLLARGGAVTFRFYVRGTNNNLGFFIRDDGPNAVTLKSYDQSTNTLTVEGFDSNVTDAIKSGQLVVAGRDSRNGAIETALFDCDSNVFGEAKIYLGFDEHDTTPNIGREIFLKPDWLAVSLGEDNFEYVDRGDGLYNVSVKFELDFWK